MEISFTPPPNYLYLFGRRPTLYFRCQPSPLFFFGQGNPLIFLSPFHLLPQDLKWNKILGVAAWKFRSSPLPNYFYLFRLTTPLYIFAVNLLRFFFCQGNSLICFVSIPPPTSGSQMKLPLSKRCLEITYIAFTNISLS